MKKMRWVMTLFNVIALKASLLSNIRRSCRRNDTRWFLGHPVDKIQTSPLILFGVPWNEREHERDDNTFETRNDATGWRANVCSSGMQIREIFLRRRTIGDVPLAVGRQTRRHTRTGHTYTSIAGRNFFLCRANCAPSRWSGAYIPKSISL